jgi:hypothetical protein
VECLLDREKPPSPAASSFGSDGEAAELKLSRVALMHRYARFFLILLCLPPLAGCNNSPSDYDVDVCIRNKINQRVETVSGLLLCGEYVEVLGANIADYQLDGNAVRVVADVRWKAKKVFGKSSETAAMCLVSVRDPTKSYQVDEVTESKFNVILEKWASEWKCKS